VHRGGGGIGVGGRSEMQSIVGNGKGVKNRRTVEKRKKPRQVTLVDDCIEHFILLYL